MTKYHLLLHCLCPTPGTPAPPALCGACTGRLHSCAGSNGEGWAATTRPAVQSSGRSRSSRHRGRSRMSRALTSSPASSLHAGPGRQLVWPAFRSGGLRSVVAGEAMISPSRAGSLTRSSGWAAGPTVGRAGRPGSARRSWAPPPCRSGPGLILCSTVLVQLA